MTNNDLLSDAKFSSPLENSVEKVVYVGVALMVSSIVHGMSFFFVAGAIAAAVFTFIFMGTYKDQEWKAFASEHCQIIEKKDGQNTSGLGVSLRGQIGAIYGSSSPQTVYKCDDGITYTKNN